MVHVPVQELLSKVGSFVISRLHMSYQFYVNLKEYLAKRAKLFNPNQTNPQVVHVSLSDCGRRKVLINKPLCDRETR